MSINRPKTRRMKRLIPMEMLITLVIANPKFLRARMDLLCPLLQKAK
ncbi:unnamed protein product [Cylicostephanus goldi]|uniref:Uncharacterized protein n=1 Tax=Cylicostephanus goldi TaxID=71465 RepID=A0A3P6QSV2_CYLGO|nr:unnamed protein product [Cylicostephanus goldi]